MSLPLLVSLLLAMHDDIENTFIQISYENMEYSHLLLIKSSEFSAVLGTYSLAKASIIRRSNTRFELPVNNIFEVQKSFSPIRNRDQNKSVNRSLTAFVRFLRLFKKITITGSSHKIM